MTELLYGMNKRFELFLQISPAEEPMLPHILHFQRKLLLTTGNLTKTVISNHLLKLPFASP